jgi:azurin
MRKLVQAAAAAALVGAFMLPAHAAGKVCKLEIAGNDMMKFDQQELKVAGDCAQVELTLKHTGKLPAQAMGHNWTLVQTADLAAVANAGMSAGLDKDYLPAGDKRVLAHTKVIGGGQTTSVTFPTASLKKGGDYSFLCTFPGHSALMKGKFVFG